MMRAFRTAIFVSALLGLLPVASNAQPVLAYVAAKDANPKRLEVFKTGLTELGLIEGRNIRLEYREAVLDSEYDGVVAELVERKVDVILAANVAATRAAARLTNTIPIVMMAVFDPVGIGVVNSLERPGTNVTGTTMYAPQLIGERLRILKRLNRDLDKVTMALNGQNPNNASQFAVLRAEADKLDIRAEQLDIRTPEDVDVAFNKALAFGAKGLLNAVDTFINSRRFALAAGAAQHRLPFIYSDVEYVMAGGLMASGRATTRVITVRPNTWTGFCMAPNRPICQSPGRPSSP
jgi:putative tryptophan/tyrosine transport system substrate-binding protein